MSEQLSTLCDTSRGTVKARVTCERMRLFDREMYVFFMLCGDGAGGVTKVALGGSSDGFHAARQLALDFVKALGRGVLETTEQ